MTSADIKAKAQDLGFDLCGIAPASDHPELTFFREWLDRGYAGDMAYLNRSAERRAADQDRRYVEAEHVLEVRGQVARRPAAQAAVVGERERQRPPVAVAERLAE